MNESQPLPQPPSPERWRAVKAVLEPALELEPPHRTAFLDHACRHDEALRREVEAFLAHEATGSAFLDDGAVDFCLPLLPEVSVPTHPEQIGPYRLVREVGRGGMGQVFLAERADGQFEQRVALKLLRPGLDTDDLTRRFLAERQILASLNHPHIARLLDGGVTGEGQPYFVMEYVEGEPITACCDRRRLGIDERLALFAEVCEAVAYAHARLVVHRDLKPSNVLVTDPRPGSGSGSRPRVKLLDFGIAKLLQPDGEQTHTARQLLTPAYAAPEQVAGGPITTAADVYGLGVLLYELLTGTRPERGEATTRPSASVTGEGSTDGRTSPDSSSNSADDAGALRSTTTTRLRRRLRGDLDRIVLKALRTDPERRYRGAAELGADVQRHLAGQPIEARPESTTYRVGKFVRRNGALVTAAVVALLAVVGGAGAALYQAAEADRQRQAAAREAATSTQVATFMTDLFREANSDVVAGDTVSAREMLDRGFAQIDSLDRTPDVQADLLATLGEIYGRLGRFDEAQTAFSRVVDIRRTQGDALSVVGALKALAYVRASERAFPEAIEIYRAALAQAGEAGASDTLRASLHLGLGNALLQNGELDEALRALDEAAPFVERTQPADATQARALRSLRAKVLVRQDDFAGAARLYEQNIRQLRALGDERTLAAELVGLGFALKRGGDPAGALPVYQEALEIVERTDREGHRNRAVLLSNISRAAAKVRDFKTGEDALLQRLDLETTFQEPGHWRIGSAHGGLAEFYRDFGRPQQALPHHWQAVAIFAAALGPVHPWTATARAELALTLLQLGADEDAERELDVAAAALRQWLDGGDTFKLGTRQALTALIEALDEQGLTERASALRALLAAGS